MEFSEAEIENEFKTRDNYKKKKEYKYRLPNLFTGWFVHT